MRLRKTLIGAAGVAAALTLMTSAVLAATGDKDDHLSQPAGTVISGSLKSGTNMVFKGTINGVPITVSCTSFSGSGKVPAKGLSVTIAPPSITGCTDSLGGTDTIVVNQTNGKWKLSEIDAKSDEAKSEPNATGDKLSLAIPKAGAKFSSSVLSSCTVTAAPSGTAKVTGSYNDVNTDTVTNAAIPVSGSGCSAGATTVTATVVLSPNVGDVS